jgi:hypothetical protein
LSTVTIKERQSRGRERLCRAVPLVRQALHDYARQRGGRFIIFGSVARDEARYDSDMDIAVDFPAPLETAAWYFAEQLCIEHGITPDIHALDDLRSEIRERALREGDVVQ